MLVKAAPGLKVRRPESPHNFLPDDGAEVSLTASGFYWQRRLDQGDVIDVEKANAAEKKAAEAEESAAAADKAAIDAEEAAKAAGVPVKIGASK